MKTATQIIKLIRESGAENDKAVADALEDGAALEALGITDEDMEGVADARCSIERTVSDAGRAYIAECLRAAMRPRYRHPDPEAEMVAYVGEVEQHIGDGAGAFIELSQHHTFSGHTETIDLTDDMLDVSIDLSIVEG